MKFYIKNKIQLNYKNEFFYIQCLKKRKTKFHPKLSVNVKLVFYYLLN